MDRLPGFVPVDGFEVLECATGNANVNCCVGPEVADALLHEVEQLKNILF